MRRWISDVPLNRMSPETWEIPTHDRLAVAYGPLERAFPALSLKGRLEMAENLEKHVNRLPLLDKIDGAREIGRLGDKYEM